MPDLLIELFSEEIPARMQARAADDLKKLITDGLVEAGLTYVSAGAFHTPRRLALSVEGLTGESPNSSEERKGPRTDAPSQAVQGFIRAVGLDYDNVAPMLKELAEDAQVQNVVVGGVTIEKREDKKGTFFHAVVEKSGRPAANIVAEVLEHTIRNFPWPKSMRWGAGSLKWVRPLHSILCILSDEGGAHVVPLDVDCITSGDTTEGHRFHSKGQIKVSSFDDYAAKLKKAHVVLDAAERADHIWADATNMAFAQGLEVVEDKGLLAEVAGLVEWPVVLMGSIAEDFLNLPPEVLQTSMKEHQKFFSVRNPKTKRIETFVTVANRETADHGETILAGNQKVLFARLSDAKFFWENDLRTVKAVGLEGMAKPLADVTFHNKLGSQADRIERIEALAREIATEFGYDFPDLVGEAARIAKADLTSQMVGEFPELQGLMGRYYAEVAGHDDGVPQACEEHYSPLGPSDDVPTAPISVAVALADKIDTLIGFWAIDEKPTGSKDPFALRRSSLGVIRLVLENEIRTDLIPILKNQYQVAIKHIDEIRSRESAMKGAVFGIGRGHVGNVPPEVLVPADLLAFLHDRLKVYLRDQGVRHDAIDACIAMPGNDDLTLLVKRATALSDFLKTDDGENLLQGFKRANNILSQAEENDGVEYSYGADVKFAEGEQEKDLFAALAEHGGAISSAIETEDFAAAMQGMAALRTPIDAFFEAVQVNADSAIVRRNRLNLLGDIRKLCLSVADLTLIEG